MHLIDDDGREVNADYQVEADKGQLALVMESSNGGAKPRNPDYSSALTILLRRLGELNATLADGLVDSMTTRRQGVIEADRRFIYAPIRLALEPDIEGLRRRLGTAQAKVAQSPRASKGGNSTRRIVLRVEVPSFGPGEASRLEQVLAESSAVARVAAGQEQAQPPSPELPSPVEQAVEAVNEAAGKITRRGRGQGFQLDQKAKVAVEARAMKVATDFYSEDWEVEDVSARESYDLICRRGAEVRHVEVKGTTQGGAEVILTPNEVTHARENSCAVLFVVSGITIERAEDGTVTGHGGEYDRYDPWHLDDGTLSPLGFRYQVPPGSKRD